VTDREDVLLRSAPPANFFRQNATEGHNHHCGSGRGAAPQSPKPIAAFPSEHLTENEPFGVALPLTESRWLRWSRPASLRRLSMGPRLRISRSPASPRPCRVHGRRKPVSATHRTGLAQAETEIGEQRLAPQSHQSSPDIPEFAGQRLRRASLSRGNIGGSHTPGYCIVETALAGWAWRIRTSTCHFERRLLEKLLLVATKSCS
jgi:hypothetical protein